MKKILMLIVCLFIFLVSCKEEYFLNINDEYLNIEIYKGEEKEIIIDYSEGATLFGFSSNDEIVKYDNKKIKGIDFGSCEITIRLDEDATKKVIINVVVKPLYDNYLSFDYENIFKNKIEIIKKNENKKTTLEDLEINDFIEEVKLIYYIETEEDFKDLKVLYTIKSNDNNIIVYENNLFRLNDKNYKIISLEYNEENIYTFDFLNDLSYTESVDSGWLPWV